MTAALRLRRVPGLLVAGVVSAVLVAVMAFLPSGTPAGVPGALPVEGPAAEAMAYLDAVEPLARTGGRIVTQGMKPGLTDVRSGDQSDELLIDSAKAWADQMRQVKGFWRQFPPPEPLAEAHAGFLAALDRYIGVAIVLEEAARVPVDQREPFIDLAGSEGELADDAWDAAAFEVQAYLRSLGLDPVTWLPVEVSGNEPSTGTS